MGRLAPSHPVARYGPQWLRDKIDVVGAHLIWQGAMTTGGSLKRGLANRKYPRHTEATRKGDINHMVSRVVYSLIHGVDLTPDQVMWHKPECIHDSCVSSACYEVISHADFMRRFQACSNKRHNKAPA
jgi:hypothetical protein